MFNNLKYKLSLTLFLVFAVFLVQGYISSNSYQVLLSGLKQTQKLSIEVVNVKSLEQQVTDLKRNVLLYRETGSASVITRFNTIVKNVDIGVTKLTVYANSKKDPDKYLNLIRSMKTHLYDYQNHFFEVQQLSVRKEALFNRQSQEFSKKIKENVENLLNNTVINFANKDIYIKILNNLNELEYINYQYFTSRDASFITQYQKKLSIVEQQLQQLGNTELSTITSELRKGFFQLVQLTRNYSYLVNVVMSGSANEFFYLAGKLSELVLTDLEMNNTQLDVQAQRTIQYNNYLFIISFIILSTLVVLILKKLILPIEKLTSIFQSLSSNKPITDPLNVNRSDEVGKLYSAAAAFKEKNAQTEQLLSNAHQLNERLSETTQRANKASKSKSIFLANMSHEIRTPMNGIVGMIDLLQRTSLDSEQKDFVEKVRYSGQILMSVINDILDFSKIEAGKLSLENICFSPTEAIENIIEAITIKANEKNLNVHCSFSSSIPEKILGDPVRLSQILLNLGNNAVKFTKQGKITFNVEYRIQANEHLLIMSVQDTGIGIPAGKIDKIFEDFSQAEEDTTRTFGGTGLGLSIAKQLSNLMNGQITVTSQESKGSCFALTLPIELVVEEKITKTQTKPKFKKLILCHLDNKAFVDANSLALISQKVIVKNNINTIQPLIDVYTQQQNGAKEDFSVIFTTKSTLSDENNAFINKLIKTIPYVGIITDTEPKNHYNNLVSLWPKHVIHQPVTPSKLVKLLSENLNSSEQKTIQHKAIQLPKFIAHVLLVEDNAINQVVAGKMLRSFGITFEIAEDGEQAVRKVVNNANYDLVFMDIQMPVMDGYQATKSIREKGFTDLLICGLSANAMSSDISSGLASGMNDYITKPLKVNAIEEVLIKYLSHLQITAKNQVCN